MRRERLADLDVVLAGGPDREGGGDGPLVVLLHGFGAPGDDLVPLWRVLDVPREVRFVFPAAPLAFDLGFGEARAWWMLDLERLQHDLEAGQPSDRAGEVPPGLAEARAQLVGLLDAIEQQLAPGGVPLIMGGFSQGAMLGCDVALRSPRRLAGLVLMSGTLLAEHEWVPLMPARRGLHVFQSHGLSDPLLPFARAERLRDQLRASGLHVRWLGFPGGHEIPSSVVDALGEFLTQVVQG